MTFTLTSEVTFHDVYSIIIQSLIELSMMEEVRTCHNSISIASDPPNSLHNILCLPRRWSSSPRRNILLTNGNRTISSKYQAVELAEHITQQITYTWYIYSEADSSKQFYKSKFPWGKCMCICYGFFDSEIL